jgi:enoyl-CoA hydratase
VPIHYELDGHVATLTIDRPERRNALDLEHWHALAQAWRRFRDEAEARVAILTGVGGSFCAGADIKDFLPLLTRSLKEGVTEVDGMRLDCTLEATLRDLPIYKPIIAAVNGPCVAGGMEILGGTDIRIAGEGATFGVMEPKRGVVAGGGTTVRLPRQLAWPAAMEILLTADVFDARRALQLGLVNEVVPDDEVLDRAREWAARIVVNSPSAVAATKESALRGLQADSFERALDLELELATRVQQGADAIEGARAFAEKRNPIWTTNQTAQTRER